MKDELFDELLANVKEGGAILRGEKVASRTFHLDRLDIKQIRETYDLTQEQFAAMLGISVSSLRNWEQGRREPERLAMVLLRVAARHPDAVLDAVRIWVRKSNGKYDPKNNIICYTKDKFR